MPKFGKKYTFASRHYDTAIHAALSALKRGDGVTAERLALRAASLDPDSEAPWLILASLAGPDESLAYVKKALQINPESRQVQQAMEWVLGRLQVQAGAVELQQPHDGIHLLDDMIEMPEEFRSVAAEPEPAAEQLPSATSQGELPAEPPHPAVKPEPASKPASPFATIPNWIAVEALPHANEPKQPPMQTHPPTGLPSWAKVPPGEEQLFAAEPEPPAEQNPPESKYDRSEAKTSPFVMQPDELHDLTDRPVETSKGTISSYVMGLELTPEQILRSPVSRIETSPAIVQPNPPVKERKRIPLSPERIFKYMLIAAVVVAFIAVVMLLLPQLTNLWMRFFPGK
jgi:hypothetical protein